MKEKNILSQCESIAVYSFRGRYRKIKFFAIKISGNKRLRNDKAAEIYKVFRKLYGRYIFFAACFKGEIAFLGTSYNKKNKFETVISDWFGYETNAEVVNRIEEVDFSNYSDKSIGQLYTDYVWAIARPYVKYRESKMFLIFGCGYLETYETFAKLGEDVRVPTIKIDREETLRVNALYYPDIYGDDYFMDESGEPDDSLDILDEDDAEFEWTMLEMDLAKEKEYMNEEEYDAPEKLEEKSTFDNGELSEMNPEEMLKYIQNN